MQLLYHSVQHHQQSTSPQLRSMQLLYHSVQHHQPLTPLQLHSMQLLYHSVQHHQPSTSPAANITSPSFSTTSQSTVSPVSQTAAPTIATSPTTLPSTMPTTTTTTLATTMTTTPAPPLKPKLKLEFKVQEKFTQELSKKESPEYKTLEKRVTVELDGVYNEKYGSKYNRSVINGFREGSIVVDSELVFNNETALPNTSDVVETLKNASSSPGFNFTVNITSIVAEVVIPTPLPPVPTTAITTPTTANMTSVTANATTPVTTVTPSPTNATTPVTTVTPSPTNATTPVTTVIPSPTNATLTTAKTMSAQPSTQAVTPAATTVPADSKLKMTFALKEDFIEGLETLGSVQFVSLSTTLTNRLNDIYRKRFRNFLRVLIRAFRRGSITVDSDVIFANASSVPDPQDVADTLVNNSASLNYTLNTTSVVVTTPENATTPASTVTPSPTNATTLSNATTAVTTMTPSPTNATLTTAGTTAAPTTTTTAAPTDPPAATEGFLFMKFGLNRDFNSELADNNSTAFLQLASAVVKEINRICLGLFSGYSRSRVNSFKSGSVISNLTLVFRNTSVVPNLNNALPLLERELLNSTLGYINGSLVLVTTMTPSPTNATLTTAGTTAAPTTTTTAAPTDPPAATEGFLFMKFGLNRDFNSELADNNSTAFLQLASAVVKEINRICLGLFSGYSRSRVNSFKSGSVISNLTLVFRNTSVVPNLNNALPLLERELLNSTLGYINGSLVLVTTMTPSPTNATLTTAGTTAAPTTTTTAAPTDPPAATEGFLFMKFGLNRDFNSELADNNSTAFLQLASAVVKEINRICLGLFSGYSRSRVNSFKSGSVISNLTLVFRNTSVVPNLNNALPLLERELLNSTLGYINGSLVLVTTMTPSPTNATLTTAGTTAAPTTTTTAAPTDPPAATEGFLFMKFGLNRDFNSELADNNSTAFLQLASAVVKEINRICLGLFSGYSRSRVNSFKSGSVISNLTLVFRNTSVVPNLNNALPLLERELLNSTLGYINGSLVLVTTMTPSPTNATLTTAGTTAAPTTTTTAAPTDPPAATEGFLFMKFGLNRDFNSELADNNSTAFLQLASAVVKEINRICLGLFSGYSRSRVNSFKSGSVISNLTLVFRNTSVVPNLNNALPLLERELLNSTLGYINGSLVLVTTMTPSPTNATLTTAGTTATTTTTAAPTDPPAATEGFLFMKFGLNRHFNSELADNNSTAFLQLASAVVKEINRICLGLFSGYSRSRVNSFKSGSVISNLTLVFRNTSVVPNLNNALPLLERELLNSTLGYINGSLVLVTSVTPPPTTLTTVTPATTPVPADSKLQMTFALVETFIVGLETPGSVEFVSLSTTLTNRLNDIYRKRFRAFLRVLIRAFRRGSIIVESDVIFANASSVPDTRDVAETLVNNSASLNYTLNITSVVVTTPENATTAVTTMTPSPTNATLTTGTTAAPTTTTTAAPTDPPAATEGFLFMKFGLNRHFNSELADNNSTAFLQLASAVVKEINRICLGLFSGYSRSRVNSFKSGSVISNLTLVFRNTSVVPNLNNALPLLERELLNSTLGYINGSLVLVTSVTPPPTTLTTVTPATTPVPADSKLQMTFALVETFIVGLETPGSVEFVSLSTTLTNRLNDIYRKRFRAFLRVLIRAFRRGSIIVESDVIFANASSVPDTRDVAETLVNNSASLNYTLNITSVVVTISHVTSAPENATTAVTTMTPSPTNATLTTAGTTAAPTTTTTAAPTDPPAATEGFLFMKFGLNRDFNSELADNTSTAFLQLASAVVKEINRICLGLFSGYSRSRVNSFKSGSVISNLTLVFRSTSVVPNLNNALPLLERELLNSTLGYINGSLVLASGGPPQPTMGSLTFFSLIMLAVAQMLINS
ncbi:mucin-5AC-like isoform X1 [Xiphophorus couchianus]|uniref:mucin-5AC-like isoform X1 n=1 Tax=Xiphophorus couchianus TaxID=32473 RepID=UPI0010165358|nr:mucin-5AC-like isoform X1 [Xiphophorus couchianus]